MVKDAVSPSVLANHLLSVFVKLHLLPLGTKKQVPVPKISKESKGFTMVCPKVVLPAQPTVKLTYQVSQHTNLQV